MKIKLSERIMPSKDNGITTYNEIKKPPNFERLIPLMLRFKLILPVKNCFCCLVRNTQTV